jgi:two-component system, OmpR family, sensor histidine kinase KdpD
VAARGARAAYDYDTPVRIPLGVDRSRVLGALGWQVLSLLAATLVIALVERALGVADASAIYLAAVAWVAFRAGTWAAAGSAVGAFILYNYLFISPQFTLRVGSAQGIVTLLLLLGLGIVIGQLAGTARARAAEAARSEREARASADIARELSEARRLRDALPGVLDRLSTETHGERCWVRLRLGAGAESLVADSGDRSSPTTSRTHAVLRRREGRAPEWVRITVPASPGEAGAGEAAHGGRATFRVPIESGGDTIGSLWVQRPARIGRPTPEETRLLAATADVIGQSVDRDRMVTQALELEVARRGDELKSALLDSVSHDLRTPLAAIRAAAGNLADPAMRWTDGARISVAQEIDAQAAHLAGLVESLLDMSRIRGGALHPEVELIPVDEVVAAALHGLATPLGDRRITVRIPAELPPLAVDPTLVGQVLANLLENIARHTPPTTELEVSAAWPAHGTITLRVEDSGPGLPDAELQRRFSGPAPPTLAATGLASGLGLAIVRGLVEVMGGDVRARRGSLGGLCVELDLPAGVAPRDG